MKLLLIHGAGNRKEVWDDLKAFLPRGIDVYALDLPGHGESLEKGRSSMEDYAEWVERYIKENSLEGVVVAGHSMGGAIAITLLSKNMPHILGGVLISTGCKLRVNPKILDGLRENYIKAVREIAPWTVSKKAEKSVLDKVIEIFSSCDPRVAYNDFLACDKFDGRDYARNIRIPVSILVGKDDVMTPVRLSEELKELIPSSQLKVIEGAGHMLQLEKPKELATSIMDFVRGL